MGPVRVTHGVAFAPCDTGKFLGLPGAIVYFILLAFQLGDSVA